MAATTTQNLRNPLVSVAVLGGLLIAAATTVSVFYSRAAYVDLIFEYARLLPSDGAADDRFGNSVGINGTAAIVDPRRDGDIGFQDPLMVMPVGGRASKASYLYSITRC